MFIICLICQITMLIFQILVRLPRKIIQTDLKIRRTKWSLRHCITWDYCTFEFGALCQPAPPTQLHIKMAAAAMITQFQNIQLSEFLRNTFLPLFFPFHIRNFCFLAVQNILLFLPVTIIFQPLPILLIIILGNVSM